MAGIDECASAIGSKRRHHDEENPGLVAFVATTFLVVTWSSKSGLAVGKPNDSARVFATRNEEHPLVPKLLPPSMHGLDR